MRCRPLLLCLPLLAAACQDRGSASVAGTIDGAPLTVRSAVFVNVAAKGFDFDGSTSLIALSDQPDLCGRERERRGSPNARVLYVGLSRTNGIANEPGAYDVVTTGPTGTAAQASEAFYERSGADCRRTVSVPAQTGIVTVEHTDAATLRGSLDLTFEGGAHLTGSFSADHCAAFDPNTTPLEGCPR
jgi:hypothetical protein